ncbi:hypothetical protein KJ591_00835 [Patescibacteria group bacterium]|nr:hypothetical protein [Patescibacteria group bacterium]
MPGSESPLTPPPSPQYPPATPSTPPEPRPEPVLKQEVAKEGSGERFGEGPGGQCVCPGCGTMAPHETGRPCYEVDCPNCGQKMIRPKTEE